MDNNINMQGAYMQGGYQQYVQPKKKLSVKGLVITILSLVTSLITAFSVFMPLISYKGMNVNFIDICKNMIDLFEGIDLGSFSEIIGFIFIVLALVTPIVIMVAGIIISIINIVKLATLKLDNTGIFSIKFMLKLEMILSVFCVVYTFFVSRFQEGTEGMSIGWYLPVIMCISTLIISSICEMVSYIRERKGGNNYTLMAILSIIAMSISSVIYIAFGMSQVKIDSSWDYFSNYDFSYEVYTVLRSFILPEYLWEGDGLATMIWICISVVLIILITLFASISLAKNIRAVKKGKFGGITTLLTGIFAVVFYLVEYIMGAIIASGVDRDLSMVFGAAGYIYIIGGALLIIVGIVQICVKRIEKQ